MSGPTVREKYTGPDRIIVHGTDRLESGWRNGLDPKPSPIVIKAPWGINITIKRNADQKAKVDHGRRLGE